MENASPARAGEVARASATAGAMLQDAPGNRAVHRCASRSRAFPSRGDILAGPYKTSLRRCVPAFIKKALTPAPYPSFPYGRYVLIRLFL